jgi:hypothetical protein
LNSIRSIPHIENTETSILLSTYKMGSVAAVG